MANYMIQDSKGAYHIKGATHLEILKLASDIILTQLENKDVMGSPDDTRKFIQLRLSCQESERFCVLYLDSRNRVIEFETPFYGTLTGASVYPREIVKRSLQLNAAGVIFAHNHPSGLTTPSDADKTITQRLKDALALIDVRVLDHLVVGNNVLSFAERGLL
jgi:DNA repair protein RadC